MIPLDRFLRVDGAAFGGFIAPSRRGGITVCWGIAASAGVAGAGCSGAWVCVGEGAGAAAGCGVGAGACCAGASPGGGGEVIVTWQCGQGPVVEAREKGMTMRPLQCWQWKSRSCGVWEKS